MAEFAELKRLAADLMKAAGSPMWSLVSNFPRIFMNIPFTRRYAVDFRDKLNALHAFYQRQIEEHEKDIDFEVDSQPLDYAEAFLREKRKKDQEDIDHVFTYAYVSVLGYRRFAPLRYHQLRGMCQDLFFAGQVRMLVVICR